MSKDATHAIVEDDVTRSAINVRALLTRLVVRGAIALFPAPPECLDDSSRTPADKIHGDIDDDDGSITPCASSRPRRVSGVPSSRHVRIRPSLRRVYNVANVVQGGGLMTEDISEVGPNLRYRVLVVDDDKDFREGLGILFESAGWDVVKAADGDEALAVIDDTFDALVIDGKLPGKDGLDVTRELRQRPEFAQLFIAMLTGYSSTEFMETAEKAGVDHYVTKPIFAKGLLQAMAFGVNGKRTQVSVVRAFLCHSSSDKDAVRHLYERLKTDLVRPWLDSEDIVAGRKWEPEIKKAIRASDVVVVCLSRKAVTKAGYLQREIKDALDVAEQEPEGSIFIIPVRLDDCDVPERLAQWQWIDYGDPDGYDRLIHALRTRASELVAAGRKPRGLGTV